MEQLVLEKIQAAVEFAKSDRTRFAAQVRKSTDKDAEKAMRSKTAELAKADRRIAEFDKIISKLYEDHVAEKISDERFAKMLGDYEADQKELVSGTAALREEVEAIRSKTADLQSFMNLVNHCAEITELTADVARTFVDRIIVHEAVYMENKPNVKESQEIHIYLNFIGKFSPE